LKRAGELASLLRKDVKTKPDGEGLGEKWCYLKFRDFVEFLIDE
jgi:hypothetical protein